jgi:AcrR family transcriptional regulator
MRAPELQKTDRRETDKREAILDAALLLFAERGFFGTSVPEIAAKAGVGAGTIYRYFESKEALVNAVFLTNKQKLGAAILTGLDVSAAPRQVFHEFWQKACAFAKDHPIILQFLELHHHGPYLDPQSRAMEDHLLNTSFAFMAQAIEKQVFKAVNPAILMAIVWGSFRALIQGGCDGRITLDDALIGEAEQCVWEAIRR